jgi:hypothetical protein
LITKPAETGGRVDRRSVTEQLLYELHDPGAYLTPDVVMDITGVTIAEEAPDRVRLNGARGLARPERLKATVSLPGGWLGEGEISYAGPNARARAELAGRTLLERLRLLGLEGQSRLDLIGVVSVFDGDNGGAMRTGHADATPGFLISAAPGLRERKPRGGRAGGAGSAVALLLRPGGRRRRSHSRHRPHPHPLLPGAAGPAVARVTLLSLEDAA